MLKTLVSALDRRFKFEVVSAHCDIPCKIYDPAIAQIATLSVIRFVDLIEEQLDKPDSVEKTNTLTRLIAEKEVHARKVKDEVGVIWGDYVKQPQLDEFPELHELAHSIMLAASACKQKVDRAAALDLLQKVNRFAEIFWATKNVKTYLATCPYPPAEKVVYPKLDG